MSAVDLCRELDKIWCEYFTLLETYQQQRKRTNFLVNNGFLELAHSKYIMGPNKITRYQYDKRMQATTRLEWTTSESTAAGKWIITLNNVADEGLKPDSDSNKKLVDSVAIRKRGPRITDTMPKPVDFSFADTKKDDQQDEMQLSSFVSATESFSRQARCDPVNWFGVLTPAPLRNAQSSFQQAVLELISCANLKSKLDAIHARLELLQARKNAGTNG